MAVPAWTAREWRPLARDLYAHVVDKHSDAAGGAVASESTASGGQESSKRLLLRADKLVAKLYSHRYMDITPQQIKTEVQELSEKMEIHLLPKRGQRLRELTATIDYRVVKMLMELAEAPTQASDAHVAVDHAMPLEALQAWNRLLTPSKQAQKAERRAREDAALAAKMEAELLQVAWEDDWWKERGDDDASEWDEALASDSDGLEDEDWLDERSVPGIASRLLDDEESGYQRKKSIGEDVEMHDSTDEGGGVTDGVDEGDDEGDEEDELLLAYYPRVEDDAEDMETEDGLARTPYPRASSDEACFTMETPGMLLQCVEAEIASKRQRDTCASTGPTDPRRVVHERVFVDAVFYALHGVATPLFEFRQRRCSELFNGDVVISQVSPTPLVVRGVAISHLSPLTLRSICEKIATAASDLQFLRDLAAFLASSPSETARSTTAEGLADEIAKQIHHCKRVIDGTYREMNDAAKGSVSEYLSCGQGFDPSSSVGSVLLLPTLLSAIGSFKKMFSMLAWLRGSLLECFAAFKDQPRTAASAAHVSGEVLSSLFRQLQLAFIESSSDLPTNSVGEGWDSYDVLSKMFAGALIPYLDAMDQVLFQRGYDERIQLHRELFFVNLENDRTMPLSPRSTAQRLLEETFEGAMKAMMPFRVDARAVPVFLEASVKRMSAALESRQIMNQYQNQHAVVKQPRSSIASLSELFATDFAPLRHASRKDQHAAYTPPTMPFDEVVRSAIITHVHDKCASINGAISDLFRDKLLFREHIEVVRLFLLMHQQDVFTSMGQFLIEQMQMDPVGWARTELLNTALQDAIHRLYTEGLLTKEQREIAARLSIRVDTKELEQLRVTRHIDIMALRHLQFKFTTSQPLRVLFSGSIIHKYSTLGILLLQVKVAELMLTNFKEGYRHRMCFAQTQSTLRSQLVRLADMLHYTRAVLNYLANQMTGDAWNKVERVFAESQSIREINEAHDEYLDKMLNSFFALKKHEGFTRQFLQNFNDVITFVSRVDEFVRTIERNMSQYFDNGDDKQPSSTTQPKSRSISRRRLDGSRQSLVANDAFTALYAKLTRQLRNPEANYENQIHVITIVLDAMVKNGASPHVNELLLLLTFNAYRSPSRPRPVSSTSAR